MYLVLPTLTQVMIAVNRILLVQEAEDVGLKAMMRMSLLQRDIIVPGKQAVVVEERAVTIEQRVVVAEE